MAMSAVFNKTTKIWSSKGPENGPAAPEIDPNMSCGTAILKALEKYPDEIGQISDNNGVQLTNAEIRIRSIRAAQNLLQLGLKSGDVVQIITTNHHFLSSFVFGAIFIGSPVNALDVKSTKDEIVHMLNLARPKLVLCDQDVLRTLREATHLIDFDIKHIYTFDGTDNQSRSVDELFFETQCENEFSINDAKVIKHPIAILCTSGTTGLPKGVSFSHLAMLKFASMGGMPFNPSEDAFLNFSSLYWASGWITLMVSTLCSFKRIITTESFSSELFLRMVAQYKVTMFFSAPSAMALILQNKNLNSSNLTSIKMYLCGGSAVSHDLATRMNKHMPKGVVMVGYAMSECGQIAGAFINSPPNSVGQIFPGVDVRIINENGENLGIGEEGEICILPSIPVWGYYRDVESTRKAIDEHGWLRTGDIGYIDEHGYLFLVGRLKELLKYCNYQVSPTEIENTILKHPGVSNVCVVGIPDDICGDLPAAVVVKSNDVDVNENDIANLVKDTLSDTKQIRGGVYFTDVFPLTPSGKILRRKVQEIAVQKFKDSSSFKGRSST